MKLNVIKKRSSRCPSCGEKIHLIEQQKIGQLLSCPICEETVEIIKLDPVILDLVFLPEEDDVQLAEYEYWDTYWQKA